MLMSSEIIIIILIELTNQIFKNFSVLISNAINIYRYNPHKLKFFQVLNNI